MIGMLLARLDSAWAAPPEPDTLVVQGPEVVVHAWRGDDRLREIPAAAFVIPRAELARTASARLSSVLQSLPGLYGYQSSASGEATVVDPRGFTANGETSYLKVLINGRDTRDLENGNVDWDWLSPESVQRLEVVEGPSAWAYGDGAEGGIVNIVRDEWRTGLRPRATLRAGSFHQRGGNAAAGWGDEHWSFSLGGGGRDVDGWRDRSRERVRNAHVLGSWKPGGATAVSLDVSWLATHREDPGALTPDQMAADRTQAENPDDFVASDRGTIALDLSHGDPVRGQWTLAPYARVEDFDQVRTLAFTTMFHPTSGTTMGTDLGWRRALDLGGRALKIAIGYGLESAELRSRYYDGLPGPRRSGTLVGHGEARRLTQAGFASAQLDLTPRLSARAGMRVDAIRVEFDDQLADTSQGPRTLSAASPFVALSARSGAGMVYASLTAGFRAPTLNQLYDRRPFIAFPLPAFTISNGELEPQRSWSYEVGGRWDGAAGQASSLTFYDVFVHDEIDFDLSTFSYANLGKSRHAGLLGVTQWPLPGALKLTASGTVSPTTLRGGALDGNQINAVPKGSAFGRLEWSPVKWLGMDAGVRWVAKQFLDKDNQHPLGEYATVDLGASFSAGRARLNLRLANLLDRQYSDTGFIGALGEERLIPAAGRGATISLAVE